LPTAMPVVSDVPPVPLSGAAGYKRSIGWLLMRRTRNRDAPLFGKARRPLAFKRQR
jgi:hypothetical protein